jgi:formylmethanofuran dehydrogenase subunit D
MILNTVRLVDYDLSREFAFGDIKSISENLAVALINPEDFNKLNLTPSLHLKLSNKKGEVVVRIEQDKNVTPGIIIMPISVWSNQLTYVETKEAIYKNIVINVEATREPLLTLNELISKLKA